MLIHHDQNRSYQEAASAAATHARAKLEQLIDDGRQSARRVFELVHAQHPVDRLVRGGALRFSSEKGEVLIHLGRGTDHQRLHPHAFHQAASRAGIPWSYIQLLRAKPDWGAELAAHNLSTLFRRMNEKSDDRFLVRSVGDEVRGLLSDRFKRLDSRPLLDAFAKACADVGALPLEGHISDVRVAVKAILPRVYEPVENEVMAFGVMFENSDFGAAALTVRVYTVRLICTNFAIADENLREVHLGARLPDEIEWSTRTHELEAKRTASAIGDIVRGQLSHDRIDAFQNTIRVANEEKIDPREALARLRKTLSKTETEQAIEKFNSPDVELLPPGNTTWRLSNAVSWLAGATKEVDRKIELERLAGRLLPQAA